MELYSSPSAAGEEDDNTGCSGLPYEGAALCSRPGAKQTIESDVPLYHSAGYRFCQYEARITDSATERYFKLALRAGNRGAFISFVSEFRDRDTVPIQHITTPTLIEWGEKDRWISVDNAKRFNRDIKGSKLVVYPGVGHIPMEEIPAESCADAVKFFAEPVDTVKADTVITR
jgi:pimeloyl-ACP methyl ester carboxylesterase